MRAEILDLNTRFEVRPARREDGIMGPPHWLTVSLRPCWKKPPLRLELVYMYEAQGVAYYAVRKSTPTVPS
jgi:hypothetical protein